MVPGGPGIPEGAGGGKGGRRGRARRRLTGNRPAVAVFDTPLVLAFRSGDDRTLGFFAGWVDGGRVIAVSAVTMLSVLAGSGGDGDRLKRLEFLDNCLVLSLTADVADRAERLLARVPVPTLLSADDALVAATALIQKLPLYSLDPGRYAAVAGLTALPAR